MPGKVYLVGAGPGDPELLTLRGLRALEEASVVFYDHLAPPQLLERSPANAERVYVGKKRSAHLFTQDEINGMLIDRARRGNTVVRLKGGDPYLFGRGGEEAEALSLAGIDFQVIPGVSSPAGIAAYTGIPLTHREHTSVVSVVTGHAASAIDWDRFGHAETLVILMGLTQFEGIAQQIIAAGRSPDTPAAAVRWGTRPDQRVVEGTLQTLPALIRASGLKPPATIIVGEVVRLRPRLDWFGRLPLSGRRVVVTRPRGQSAGMIARLRDLGADPIEVPTIEIGPASDYGPLDAAIDHLDRFDLLIFTSANGVDAFFERLEFSSRDLRDLRARIAAIGPATRDTLARAHLRTDFMGSEYVAESLLESLSAFPLRDCRVLLPRAALARDVLPAALTQAGAHVEVVEAYRTVTAPEASGRIAELASDPPDWVTFTSSSTVQNFFAADGAALLRHSRVASIGPITSATLREAGVEPAVEAAAYTTDGLIEALLNFAKTGHSL